MALCDICKKNVAVIFVSKIEEGKRINQGLCIECAKKHGIEPLSHMMKQSGMSDDDMENLNKQMSDMIGNMNIDDLALPNSEGEDIDKESNPLYKMFNTNKEKGDIPKKNIRTREKKDKKRKFLDAFGTNLTTKAKNNEIDRVIGRDQEISRIIQILNRRTKNNPCLIGEPGVGKTAIAEGLAVRISNKQVPVKLLNSEIYQLDMTGIVAGTQFRGQFESRMKGIIKEATTLGNIILVIDEVHNIVGAGEAEGAMNAANILKPALAKGDVQIIGATTIKEYRRFIEKDSALERRFQPILVEEPSIEETVEILKGIKDYYEDYHNVTFSDYILETAAILSERYINDRFLPDKAIDVIDEAASRVNLNNKALVKLQILRNELFNVQNDKNSAVSADSMQDYQKAAELKQRECKLIDDIKDYEAENTNVAVTFEDIASVIEAWTKIPIQRITEVEAKKLLDLENRLAKRLIGQVNAISSVSKAIRRNRSGIRPRKRPASFIFVGPTGVGKTELVKSLALELFESEEAIIRLDMSEYMEKHTVSKLIGSPPGYVGYDDGGQLTEKIRRQPYSIILFDEIEKAHQDVFNMLLQILEDGRLTDSHGRVVGFENAIIVMTSNVGNSFKSYSFGFGEDDYNRIEDSIKDSLKETFRPEFLNRVDEVVVFTRLNDEELMKIINLMISQFKVELIEKNIDLEVTLNAIKALLKQNYDEKYGARPLRRGVQKTIEDVLSEMYIKRELRDFNKVIVDYIDDKFIYNIENNEK
ncbi:MAG: ATP-dependent Clp protease ATP-binding subunit [Clostridiales bacterium]|nr:ATP-dependent Clp protease ATP-binding subunit [Clostridiales bacterium]